MTRFWLIFPLLLLGLSAPAHADGIYEADVVVDVVDKDAAKAREKAMVAANRQGLINLLKKITTADGVRQVSELNDNQILNFVKEVSVISEKVSDVRYMAELKVSFNENVLRRYLNEKGIPFTENGGFRAVIIPVFHEAESGKTLLWEPENLWRAAWENSDKSGGFVEYQVVEATGANQEMLSSGKALEFDGATLEWLSRSYKADEVYILDAAYCPGGVSVKIFAPSGRGGIEQTVSVDGGNDETTLEAAVKKVKGVISERIKRYNLEEDRRTYEMLVLYEYPSVGDWLRLQNELRKAPYVKSVKEDAMGAGRVQFRMEYAGGLDRLEQVLGSRGLQLQSYDGFYVISKK